MTLIDPQKQLEAESVENLQVQSQLGEETKNSQEIDKTLPINKGKWHLKGT